MNKMFLIIIISILNLSIVFGQNKIDVPKFNDDYSKTVQTLENGQTDIDYKAFRENFIKSEQFKIASKKQNEFSELTDEMYKQMAAKDFNGVIKTTQEMLSIDYTSLKARKNIKANV